MLYLLAQDAAPGGSITTTQLVITAIVTISASTITPIVLGIINSRKEARQAEATKPDSATVELDQASKLWQRIDELECKVKELGYENIELRKQLAQLAAGHLPG